MALVDSSSIRNVFAHGERHIGETDDSILLNRDAAMSRKSPSFGRELCNRCLHTIELICRQTREEQQHLTTSQSEILREQLGLLILWGSGFQGDSLEAVLAKSEGLRDDIFDLLSDVGCLIMSSK